MRDMAKCQTFAESAINEIRHETALASERQDSIAKRQLQEARDDLHRSFDIVRTEAQERAAILQRDSEDVMHRVVSVERSMETQVAELREQLRERLRESVHDWTKLHTESQSMVEERLQGLARQNE